MQLGLSFVVFVVVVVAGAAGALAPTQITDTQRDRQRAHLLQQHQHQQQHQQMLRAQQQAHLVRRETNGGGTLICRSDLQRSACIPMDCLMSRVWNFPRNGFSFLLVSVVRFLPSVKEVLTVDFRFPHWCLVFP